MGIIETLILNYGVLGIGFTSFLSYSLLPFPTEPVLILGLKFYSPYTVLIAALIGSSLGSIFNYYIGLKGVRYFVKRKYGKKRKKSK